MLMCPLLTSVAEARQAFEEQVIKLFFELEAEQASNPRFTLPAWMAPTFAAAKQTYDVWEQAVTAREVGATAQEGADLW